MSLEFHDSQLNTHDFTSPPASLYPPGRQHAADPRPDALAPAAEQIRLAGARLLEEPLLLEGFAENDLQHSAVPRVGHRLDARPPAVNECLRRTRVLLDNRVRHGRPLAGGATLRFGHIVGDSGAQLDDGARDPGQLHLLAV